MNNLINNLDQSNNNLSSLDNTGTTSHRMVALRCGSCGNIKIIRLKCSDRTCSECRKRIYFKLLRGWTELVRNMKNPKLLTLTLVNKQYLLRNDITFIRKSLNKLLRRKYYKERIKGGLYVIEIINKGRGWNIHIHALIESAFIKQNKISQDWLDITRNSFIVDIRDAYTPVSGLRYILKYLTKTPQIGNNADVYNRALKYSRLIQTFGNLYGNAPDKMVLACEQCGSSCWITEHTVKGKVSLTKLINFMKFKISLKNNLTLN